MLNDIATVVYSWLAMLALSTGVLYWRARTRIQEEDSPQAARLALGVLIVAFAMGLNDAYWMLSPLLKVSGYSDAWMHGTKPYLSWLGVLAIVGYSLHQYSGSRPLKNPNTWIWVVGGTGLAAVSLVLSAHAWRAFVVEG